MTRQHRRRRARAVEVPQVHLLPPGAAGTNALYTVATSAAPSAAHDVRAAAAEDLAVRSRKRIKKNKSKGKTTAKATATATSTKRKRKRPKKPRPESDELEASTLIVVDTKGSFEHVEDDDERPAPLQASGGAAPEAAQTAGAQPPLPRARQKSTRKPNAPFFIKIEIILEFERKVFHKRLVAGALNESVGTLFGIVGSAMPVKLLEYSVGKQTAWIETTVGFAKKVWAAITMISRIEASECRFDVLAVQFERPDGIVDDDDDGDDE
ncbi:hypothetical protein DFJ73DRAFT_796879 [Zopfochytrium polystomum]|nr:hypothetical protein DFJ73DRAFT_796879 [Zopfochytrium polystomum]